MAGRVPRPSAPLPSLPMLPSRNHGRSEMSAIITGARLEGPVPGDPFLIAGGDPAAAGYLREEWFLEGTASGYALRGERGEDGRWQAERAASAPFKTRIVVLRPEDPAR